MSTQSPPFAAEPAVGKAHARRLRDIYRSAGWPCQDMLEIELLAAGLLDRVRSLSGHESLRVTEAGLQLLAATLGANRAAYSAHEALVECVARDMARAGRIAWRGLSLRAQRPAGSDGKVGWCIARPDVFSIRNTSVEHYVDPIVHEIKVRRADLLGDLKQDAKRAAYLDLGETWYVLGSDARGRCIAGSARGPGHVWRHGPHGRTAVGGTARPATQQARPAVRPVDGSGARHAAGAARGGTGFAAGVIQFFGCSGRVVSGTGSPRFSGSTGSSIGSGLDGSAGGTPGGGAPGAAVLTGATSGGLVARAGHRPAPLDRRGPRRSECLPRWKAQALPCRAQGWAR